MSPPYLWHLDPLVSRRRLDEFVLAHHAGSGDTHLLTPFSDTLLSALPVGGTGRSLPEILADPVFAELDTSEGEVTDALCVLADAGLVHTVDTE